MTAVDGRDQFRELGLERSIKAPGPGTDGLHDRVGIAPSCPLTVGRTGLPQITRPDLAHAVNTKVSLEHAEHLRPKRVITPGPNRPLGRLSVASETCDNLYYCADGVCDRGARAMHLPHAAAFHSKEMISPSNHGIRYQRHAAD